jgi:hypothetical protein
MTIAYESITLAVGTVKGDRHHEDSSFLNCLTFREPIISCRFEPLPNAAYPKAFSELKAAGSSPEPCVLRQVKYWGNLIEQDHRFIKRLTKPGMGFFSDLTAWRTLQGFEMMNMLRKGQVQGVAKGDVGGQVALVARLFGVIA